MSSILRTRPPVIDEFNALSARWTAAAGAFDVTGGALAASALADWLGNLVTNGEFTTNVAGITSQHGAILAWRDSTALPGTISPGADVGCLEVAASGGD